MQLAIEIGQLEIGGFERGESGASRRSSFAEIPHPVFVIVYDRLTEMARECREVEFSPAVADKFSCARPRNRNADIADACTFRF